jgi:hypothetical protein
MKNTAVLLIAFFIGFDVSAQVYTSGVSNSNLQTLPGSYFITLPVNASPWLIPNDGVTTPLVQGTAASVAFVEFGDGTFSFLPNGVHDFYLPQPTNGYQITTKTSSIYTGGGKPPNYQVARFFPPSTNPVVPYIPMNILAAGEKLGITPNIGSVLAKDTMIFVITYKLEMNETGKSLLFLFNDNVGNNAFESVSMSLPMNPDYTTGERANYVRTYFGENLVPISGQVANVSNLNNQYSNRLAINNLKHDGSEYNVFITLIPKDGLVSKNLSQTLVKAYIVGESRKDTISKTAILPVFNESHDPNYITVKPICLTLPKAGKELQYHVHFQNDAAGPASQVRVAVKIPDNVDINTDITYPPCPAHLVNFYKVPYGTLTSVWPYSNNLPNNDSLVFVFNKGASDNCTLEGLLPTPSCMCNQGTMGDFWFTIKTTDQMPDMLLAQASIVFYNSDLTLPPNEPILTNIAITQFRECCDCKKTCNPCKNKKGFWKWLFCKKC